MEIVRYVQENGLFLDAWNLDSELLQLLSLPRHCFRPWRFYLTPSTERCIDSTASNRITAKKISTIAPAPHDTLPYLLPPKSSWSRPVPAYLIIIARPGLSVKPRLDPGVGYSTKVLVPQFVTPVVHLLKIPHILPASCLISYLGCCDPCHVSRNTRPKIALELFLCRPACHCTQLLSI